MVALHVFYPSPFGIQQVHSSIQMEETSIDTIYPFQIHQSLKMQSYVCLHFLLVIGDIQTSSTMC